MQQHQQQRVLPAALKTQAAYLAINSAVNVYKRLNISGHSATTKAQNPYPVNP